MKLNLAISLLFVLLFKGVSAGTPLENLREFFFRADTEAGVKAFGMYAFSIKEQTALINAYRGTAKAMSAGFTEGFLSKIQAFNVGKDIIEASVKEDPQNQEIRFLRYCVQANIPGILGYSGNMNEDFELMYPILCREIKNGNSFWIKACNAIKKCENLPKKHLEKLNSCSLK